MYIHFICVSRESERVKDEKANSKRLSEKRMKIPQRLFNFYDSFCKIKKNHNHNNKCDYIICNCRSFPILQR